MPKSPAQTKILITGGSGLVGSALRKSLQASYPVAVLSRSPEKLRKQGIKAFSWQPQDSHVDTDALRWADCIVHLAGENLGDGRWTEAKKRRFHQSRVDSCRLLFDTCNQINRFPSTFVTASGVGYYGDDQQAEAASEDAPPATDFLARLCIDWERAAQRFTGHGTRVVAVRTGMVLASRHKGAPYFTALDKMALPFRFGLGAALGSGQQYLPWIHIQDLVKIYQLAIHDVELRGSINAVAPHCVTNEAFSRQLAARLQRPLWLPNTPAWLLKLMLGEMAQMLLRGRAVTPQKLREKSFSFQYASLERALKNLLTKN